MLFKSSVTAPKVEVVVSSFEFFHLITSGAGRMSETIKWARMCPSAPGVTRRPSCSTSSSTLWASTTNSLAQTETTMSKSGGTRLKKVGHDYFHSFLFRSVAAIIGILR